MAAHRSIGITVRFVEQHADPVSCTLTSDFANEFSLTAAIAYVQLTSLSDLHGLSFIFHEILIDALSLVILEICVASGLHTCLEGPESVISLSVGLFANLILFNLANVIELVSDCVTALVDDMDSKVCFRVVGSESRLIIDHLRYRLTLCVLELQSHIIGVCTELALEECLAFRYGPIEVESQFWEEGALHTGMSRI